MVNKLNPHPEIPLDLPTGERIAAAVAHYRRDDQQDTLIVGVEPIDANCVQESAEAGHIGDPNRYRDFILGPPRASWGGRHAAAAAAEAGTP